MTVKLDDDSQQKLDDLDGEVYEPEGV